jgi:hypothetical protein
LKLSLLSFPFFPPSFPLSLFNIIEGCRPQGKMSWHYVKQLRAAD